MVDTPARWLLDAFRPKPDDPADTRWGVETAASMWQRGDRDRALSWLRAAIDAARSERLEARARELTRVATEIEHSPVPDGHPPPPDRIPSTAAPRPDSAIPSERIPSVRDPDFDADKAMLAYEPTVVVDSRSIQASADSPPTMGSPGLPLAPLHGVRVVVRSGTGRALVVQRLDDGETAPEGMQEALLIALPTRASR